MNVLVYSGRGTTTESVKHTVDSLRQCLSPYYAVVTISESALLKDPWMGKSSMLVLPGGADLPYCAALNGAGNERITNFVRNGGKFLGFCAGGYYGLSRCEFEVGNLEMEVSGPRELGFFPGTLKGCVYKGFVYESHEGVKAAELDVNLSALPLVNEQPACPEKVVVYYNGGGMFLNASKYRGVEILARYTGQTDLPPDPDMAAVIYSKVGKGDVVLCGVHPEFTPALMKPTPEDVKFREVAEKIRANDVGRKQFLAACLDKLQLKVNHDSTTSIPRLSPIYMSSYLDPLQVIKVYDNLTQNLEFLNKNTFEDANDTFVLHTEDEDEHLHTQENQDNEHWSDSFDDIISSPKHIKVLAAQNLPDSKQTPYFDMRAYFENLRALYNANNIGYGNRTFGSILCYSEVVTLTNTLLDANPNWLRYLPTGLTFTATTQIAGRGRGGNVWINPKGVMATSILFRVPVGSKQSSSIITLQYLCSLALIELILGYGSDIQGQGIGYEDMPVRLKWPNDMYALKPDYYHKISDKDVTSLTVEGDDQKWAKISGALVNSQFINGEYYLVWGGGVNVLNEAPTTSLNLVLDKLNEIRAQSGMMPLPYYKHEILLARVVYTMGQFFDVFKHAGLKPFLPLYYKRWFHLQQIVKLDAEGDGRTRDCEIKGIDGDYGLLLAQDINTREILELQPDGNSFDIFNGLVYKKRQ